MSNESLDGNYKKLEDESQSEKIETSRNLVCDVESDIMHRHPSAKAKSREKLTFVDLPPQPFQTKSSHHPSPTQG
jgi:hypothetical protein